MAELIDNLFLTPNLIPSPEMSEQERLSAIVTLILIISFFLYAFLPGQHHWLCFFLTSFCAVGIIWALFPLVVRKSKMARPAQVVPEKESDGPPAQEGMTTLDQN